MIKPLTLRITPLVDAGDLQRCISASSVKAIIRSLFRFVSWNPWIRDDESENSSARSHTASRNFVSNPCVAPPGAVTWDRETGDALPPSDSGGGTNPDRTVCAYRGLESRGDCLESPRDEGCDAAESWLREIFTRGELAFDEAPALEDLDEDASLTAIERFNRSL